MAGKQRICKLLSETELEDREPSQQVRHVTISMEFKDRREVSERYMDLEIVFRYTECAPCVYCEMSEAITEIVDKFNRHDLEEIAGLRRRSRHHNCRIKSDTPPVYLVDGGIWDSIWATTNTHPQIEQLMVTGHPAEAALHISISPRLPVAHTGTIGDSDPRRAFIPYSLLWHPPTGKMAEPVLSGGERH